MNHSQNGEIASFRTDRKVFINLIRFSGDWYVDVYSPDGICVFSEKFNNQEKAQKRFDEKAGELK